MSTNSAGAHGTSPDIRQGSKGHECLTGQRRVFARGFRPEFAGKGVFPADQEVTDMKMFIILLVLLAVVGGIVRRLHKARAEEDLARRRIMERKKKQHRESITPKVDATWPVIVKPLKGDGVSDDERVEEPAMTSIEFEPAEELRTSH
jgi:hypothetical protein